MMIGQATSVSAFIVLSYSLNVHHTYRIHIVCQCLLSFLFVPPHSPMLRKHTQVCCTSASGRWGLRSFNGRTTLDAWTWRIRSLRFSKRQILSYSFTQRIKLSSTCLYAFVRAKLDLDGCNHCKLDLWMIILSHRGELFTQMVTSVLHALCLVVLWHVLLFCGAISSFVFAC